MDSERTFVLSAKTWYSSGIMMIPSVFEICSFSNTPDEGLARNLLAARPARPATNCFVQLPKDVFGVSDFYHSYGQPKTKQYLQGCAPCYPNNSTRIPAPTKPNSLYSIAPNTACFSGSCPFIQHCQTPPLQLRPRAAASPPAPPPHTLDVHGDPVVHPAPAAVKLEIAPRVPSLGAGGERLLLVAASDRHGVNREGRAGMTTVAGFKPELLAERRGRIVVIPPIVPADGVELVLEPGDVMVCRRTKDRSADGVELVLESGDDWAKLSGKKSVRFSSGLANPVSLPEQRIMS